MASIRLTTPTSFKGACLAPCCLINLYTLQIGGISHQVGLRIARDPSHGLDGVEIDHAAKVYDGDDGGDGSADARALVA